jgi:cytochrome c biogenesis protein CcmG/thiol:disulfide interchange protein DsbE
MENSVLQPDAVEAVNKPQRRRVGYLIPAVLFIALLVLLGIGLTRDPTIVPSPLIGKSIPEFDLPPLPERNDGLSNADLANDVSLVNVFASWCLACRDEHPLFMKMRAQGILPIHGINYKDRPEDAERWLAQLGDPYTRIGADRDGRVSIEWGVYGVPESFLVDRDGKILYKHIGAVTPKALEENILPLVAEARR